MAVEVMKASAKVVEGLKVEVEARGHKFILDEPKELGGSDEGMNPIEATLSALGACKCIVAQCFAKAKGIKYDEIRVEVEGDLDPDGFMGKNPEAKIGLSEIRTKFYIKSDLSKEKLEDFVSFIDKTCPVADTISLAPKLKTDLIVE